MLQIAMAAATQLHRMFRFLILNGYQDKHLHLGGSQVAQKPSVMEVKCHGSQVTWKSSDTMMMIMIMIHDFMCGNRIGARPLSTE